MLQFLGLLFLLLLTPCVYGDEYCCNEGESDLLTDLMVVDYWNRKICDRLPVMYNHFLYGGYITMPSARMGREGELAAGYSYVPPYINWNLRCQLTDRIELSGSYRIFRGIEDPLLSQFGFGDLSDKGANIKFSIFHPEDSAYKLPGIAVGFDDILGTRNFKAKYLVFTQVFLNYNFEASLGFGAQRIRGWFGGVSWMPFRTCGNSYFEGLALVAEYDATPYKDPDIEKHPGGRVKKSSINYGVKYRLWDELDFSLSWIRGTSWAASVSAYYNFGETEGFIPKVDNTLPYQSPRNYEPIGCRRTENMLVQDLVYPFRRQGFEILQIWLSCNECGEKCLRINLINTPYRLECEVRERLDYLLAGLIPSNIDRVTAVIESEGFPIQEYHYYMPHVRYFGQHNMGAYELKILSPMLEVSDPGPCDNLIFEKNRNWWNFCIFPKTQTFFGSSKGKFKYLLGVSFGLDGFLYNDLYYCVRLGYTFVSDIHNSTGIDRLNPSQLINVRSDAVRYYQQKGLTYDQLYLQKTWNLGCGWFARGALGYFEQEYAGTAAQFLYYPVNSPWAFGLEAAVLKKRTLSGLGLTDKVRKLDGFQVTYRKFLGYQYFANFYYDWCAAKLDLRIKVGKFLANDYGVRFEVSRYFESGLRMTFWYTITNGHDHINGEIYYDKGVAFSMPLDIFLTQSSRKRWGYGMSAWLRDVGVIAETGYDLYNLINSQRQN